MFLFCFGDLYLQLQPPSLVLCPGFLPVARSSFHSQFAVFFILTPFPSLPHALYSGLWSRFVSGSGSGLGFGQHSYLAYRVHLSISSLRAHGPAQVEFRRFVCVVGSGVRGMTRRGMGTWGKIDISKRGIREATTRREQPPHAYHGQGVFYRSGWRQFGFGNAESNTYIFGKEQERYTSFSSLSRTLDFNSDVLYFSIYLTLPLLEYMAI